MGKGLYAACTSVAIAAFLMVLSCNGGGRQNSRSPDSVALTNYSDSTRNLIAPSGITDTAFLDFAFVANGKYLIIAPADSDWISSNPYLPESAEYGMWSAIANVKSERIPSTYKALLDRQFYICNEQGEKYLVRISALKILSTYIAHFGQVQEWNGEGGKKFTDSQKAADIFLTGPHWLVAALDPADLKVTNNSAVFAIAAGRPVAALFRGVADAGIERTVRQAALQTLEYRDIQKAFEKSTQTHGINWCTSEDTESSFFYFTAKDGTGYATLTHRAGNPCGGDFSAEIFSLWQLKKGATPVLLYAAPIYCRTVIAVDLDGDNIPEILTEEYFGKHTLLKKVNDKWIEQYTWEVPYYDCPC